MISKNRPDLNSGISASPHPKVTTVSVPVTIITGFLGSGKTTLLNTLLGDPRFSDSAAIVNEFGEIDLDHHFLEVAENQYLQTTTGCVCCTAGSDIQTSLAELGKFISSPKSPPISRVIYETTGLADPAPIINTLITKISVANHSSNQHESQRFHLSSVIATVDAASGHDAINNYLVGWKQIAFSNDIVLTKTDLFETDMHQWQQRISGLNPFARVYDRNAPNFPLENLLANRTYHLDRDSEDVLGWLAMEDMNQLRSSHTHDVNRHGGIESLILIEDLPFLPEDVDTFLLTITNQKRSGLLRLKGLLSLSDDLDRPMVVHAVQSYLHSPMRLKVWPSADRRSRLVLIGKDMPIVPIKELFAAMSKRAKKKQKRGLFQ